MMNAPYEKEFIFHDGRRAKNILELFEIVERMPDEEFSQFVNNYKNDFANWIEYVLYDKKLAGQLRSTVSKGYTTQLLASRMQEIAAEEASIVKPQLKPDTAEAKPIAPTITVKSAESNHTITIVPATHQQPAASAHAAEVPKVRNKWFEFFGKKSLQKKELENVAKAESEKKLPEMQLKKEVEEDSSQNILWILLYGILIGLIIVLLIYKLVFNKP